MAGTLIVDSIQDSLGNSSSSTSAIKGSAKAWILFSVNSSGTVTTNKAYNISGVSRTSAGYFTLTFTGGAVSDANYAVVASSTINTNNNAWLSAVNVFGTPGSPYYLQGTTSSFTIMTFNSNFSAAADGLNYCVVVFN